MVYSGQELPNTKRLKFFEKDPIEWQERIELHDFYKTLLTLHSTSKALRAGDISVLTEIISHPEDHKVFSYLRKHEKAQVLVVLNCSDQESNFIVKNISGTFRNVFGGDDIVFKDNNSVYLKPWGYLVFERISMLSDNSSK
jgi:glycosidase